MLLKAAACRSPKQEKELAFISIQIISKLCECSGCKARIITPDTVLVQATRTLLEDFQVSLPWHAEASQNDGRPKQNA